MPSRSQPAQQQKQNKTFISREKLIGPVQNAQATAVGAVTPYASKAGKTARRINAASDLKLLKKYAGAHKRAWDSGSHFFRSNGVFMPAPSKWAKNTGSMAGFLKNTMLETGTRSPLKKLFGKAGSYTRVKAGQVDDYMKAVARAVAKGNPKGLSAGTKTARALKAAPILRPAARYAGSLAPLIDIVMTTRDLQRGYADEEKADAMLTSPSMFTAPATLYGSAAKKAKDTINLYRNIDDDTREDTQAVRTITGAALRGLFGLDDSDEPVRTRPIRELAKRGQSRQPGFQGASGRPENIDLEKLTKVAFDSRNP